MKIANRESEKILEFTLADPYSHIGLSPELELECHT